MAVIGSVALIAAGPTAAFADVDCAKVISVRAVVSSCGANPPAVAAHGPLRVWRDDEHEGFDGVVCQRVVGWPASQIFFSIRRLSSQAAAAAFVGERIDNVARRAYLSSSAGYTPPETTTVEGRRFTAWRGPGTGTIVFPAGPYAVEVTSRRRQSQKAPAPICTAGKLNDLARGVAERLPPSK